MNEENNVMIDEPQISNVSGGSGQNGKYILYLRCRNPKCSNSSGYTEEHNSIPSIFMKKCPLCQAEAIVENIGRR